VLSNKDNLLKHLPAERICATMFNDSPAKSEIRGESFAAAHFKAHTILAAA